MPTVPELHRSQAPRVVHVAILTVSDTRTAATDLSGALIADLLAAAGHEILDRRIVPDDRDQIRGWAEVCRGGGEVEAAIITGGTGLDPRDVTIEAITPLITRAIPGFGEVFRMLSYADIGSATIMSRACAGLVGRMVLFALPGSKAGVELAMTRLILPELPHLVGQARKG